METKKTEFIFFSLVVPCYRINCQKRNLITGQTKDTDLRAHGLAVSDLHLETKGSRLESGC